MQRAATSIALALTVGLTACAAKGTMRPATIQQMTQAEIRLAAAAEQGVEQDPRALRHFEHARDQIAKAKRLSADGDHAAARQVMERAALDAELAQAMARETKLRYEADAAHARTAGLRTRVEVKVNP